MRVRKVAIGASAVVAIATATCACSPADDTESREPTVFVQSTQFAPPPAPITNLVPTAEQLTALYNATTNYSIREEDRARLLEGPFTCHPLCVWCPAASLTKSTLPHQLESVSGSATGSVNSIWHGRLPRHRSCSMFRSRVHQVRDELHHRDEEPNDCQRDSDKQQPPE